MEKTKYIVKRTYSNTRSSTDAFIKLLKKDKKIGYNQYEVEYNNKVCYNDHANQKSLVIPSEDKEE